MSVEEFLRGARLDVIEVEPETRSSASGKLLRVSDGTTTIVVGVSYNGGVPAHPELESRLTIFVPWKWKDYLMRRDPHGALALRIRSMLEAQTIGRVAIKDLMTRGKKDTTSNAGDIPGTGQVPE